MLKTINAKRPFANKFQVSRKLSLEGSLQLSRDYFSERSLQTVVSVKNVFQAASRYYYEETSLITRCISEIDLCIVLRNLSLRTISGVNL